MGARVRLGRGTEEAQVTDERLRALNRELRRLPRHEWDDYLRSVCRQWLHEASAWPALWLGRVPSVEDDKEQAHAG